MKLTWHIIKNDVLRDRWALLLWSALFVARVVIGLVLLREPGNDRDWIMGMQVANGALAGLGFLMGYVLVARLVLADPLLGTDMFWATRPISRGRLLMAKTVGTLLVFGLLPVALMAPWWLWCGFDARGLFWTAVDAFGWQLLMIAPALLIASMTNEISRVLMWSVVLGVAVMLWVALLANLFPNSLGVDDPLRELAGLGYTRFWLSCCLFVVLAGAVTGHQYLTRRLARSIGLTVAMAAVVAAIGLFARMDVSQILTQLPHREAQPEVMKALEAAKVEVGTAMPDTLNTRAALSNRGEASLVTEIYFQGLPGNLAVLSGTSRQVWRWPAGPEIVRWSYIGSGPMPTERLLRDTYKLAPLPQDPETEKAYAEQRKKAAEAVAARRAARGGTAPIQKRLNMVPPSRPGIRHLVYSNVPAALITRGQTESPDYDVFLRCIATEPVILAELPLQVGAQGGTNSKRARLMWIGESPSSEPALSLLLTAPRVQAGGLWAAAAVVRDVRNQLRGEVWSINRTTGELLSQGSYSLQSTRTVNIAGVLLSWNEPRFRVGMVVRDGKLVVRDPQWVEHTSLVLVTEEAVARFNKRVSVGKLEFRPTMWLTKPNDAPPTND